MAHIGEWVEADKACGAGEDTEHILIGFSRDRSEPNGVLGLQDDTLGELDKQGREDLITALRVGEGEVAAWALIQRCFKDRHVQHVPVSQRISTHFQVELVSAGIIVQPGTKPIAIRWSTAVKGMDWDGVSEATGYRNGKKYKPVLFLPHAGYDADSRGGYIYEGRGGLLVAKTAVTQVVEREA